MKMDRPPCLNAAWDIVEPHGLLLDGAYSMDRPDGSFSVACFEQGRFFGDCCPALSGGWHAYYAAADNGTNRLAPCDRLPGEFDSWEDARRAMFERMSRPLDAAVEIVRKREGER